MTTKKLYVEKELSWLSFNHRVLQEAADTTVPIVERARFLGIYSSNMDEFFRVRVATVKRRLLISKFASQSEREATKRLMSKIQARVLSLQERFDEIYQQVLIGLARHNIFLINEDQLSETQSEWLTRYFRDKILRHIAPIICSDEVDLTKVLQDNLTYLAVQLRSKEKTQYALIEVPSNKTNRFVQLPKEKGKRRRSIILLDNIIRHCLVSVFDGFFEYETLCAYSFKMTRDAEYGLSEDIDQSLVENMSDSLKQRLTAEPVRFVHDREMPESMVEFLKYKLGIEGYDSVIPGGRYHNFRDFIGFPNIGRNYLEHPKLPALNCKEFEQHKTACQAITAQDILLHYPYHKFRYFTEFVRQAAFDPKVTEIKISIYRVAKDSRIIKSLVDAAENGKRVLVIVELRARFDEEANIEWAKVLTDAGIKVEFGLPSLKCHTKLCQLTRIEEGEKVFYSHIGTGNFHEKTAQIYTDFSLFTKNQEIGAEVEKVFDFIINPYKRYRYEHLVVSPIDSRRSLSIMIERETKAALQGQRAEIFIKVNNLHDKRLVDRLYRASQAGVKIRMIIRGMCMLVPGIPGVSDNIEIISIVDRFLEHPRVAVFYAGGEKEVYISSADWMTRNIDNRVEVGVQIPQKNLRKRIIDILELQWRDTTKARIIDAEQQNRYRPRGNKRKIRSQIAIYELLEKHEKS